VQRRGAEAVAVQRFVQHRHLALPVAEDDGVLELRRVADEVPQGFPLLVRLAGEATRLCTMVVGLDAGATPRFGPGLCRKASASRWISGGMVAEKNRVGA
jgi:hypothetical protein